MDCNVINDPAGHDYELNNLQDDSGPVMIHRDDDLDRNILHPWTVLVVSNTSCCTASISSQSVSRCVEMCVYTH